VEPALLKAVIFHETGNMKFPGAPSAKKKNNFGGIMLPKGGLRTYATPEEGIAAVAKLLGGKYKGKSIADIAKNYAPVGAANDPNNLNANWIKAVTKLYYQFR
jgi:hypothetical protein